MYCLAFTVCIQHNIQITKLNFIIFFFLFLLISFNSPMRLITAALKGLLLDTFFDVVVSAESEKLGKPYPGVYLTAATKLNVDASKCLALEDSLNGTLAAKSARMKCISIPEDYENRSKAFHIANIQLQSLEQIDDEIWKSLWG